MTTDARVLLLSCALASAAAAGCTDEVVPHRLEPTYANIEAIVSRSCNFNRCHGGDRRPAGAEMHFEELIEEGRPITELLVDVPSCEYELMPRIDPGNPDNSWLMIKLEGPYDEEGYVQFEPAPEWEPDLTEGLPGQLRDSICPFVDDGVLSFGLLMPRDVFGPLPLPPEEIALFREWIRLGAPGPD